MQLTIKIAINILLYNKLFFREKKSYNFNRGKIKFDYEAIFQKKSHIVWRTNRMDISRKLRKLFPKLPGVPDWWSPSMEKFIFIDKPESSLYALVKKNIFLFYHHHWYQLSQ